MTNIDEFLFISLPPSLQDKIPGIKLDPSILIPIEADSKDIARTLKNLTIEQVIASLLKIFLVDPPHPNLSYYKKIIFHYRSDIVSHLIEGAIQKEKAHDYDTAEDIFKIVAKLEPEEPTHIWNLAIFCDYRYSLYKKLENLQMSSDYQKLTNSYLETLFKFENIDTEYHYKASLFYIDSGDYKSAIKHLEFYLQHGSDEKNLQEANGLLSQAKNLLTNANQIQEFFKLIETDRKALIKKAQNALGENEEFWEAAFFLGWALRIEKKFKEAKEALKKAIKLNKKSPLIYNELAICHLELGELAQSKKLLEQGLKLDRKNISLLSNLALLHLKEDNELAATELFEEVLTLNPEDPIAKNFFKKM